ncbi:MAG: hypothetical protein J6U54_13555 [Clostridiales bacterium]|nr:hypothetical protein [Clostridiales bacterium]
MKDQNGSCLKHSGIKDMKWGIRRWRNYDGTLTEEGKKRYDYYESRGEKAVARQMEKNTYAPWDERGGDSRVVKTIKSAQEGTSSISKQLDTLGVGVRKKNLSTMSNEELKEAAERGRLESEYARYYPTTIKTDTRKKLDKILAAAGLALTAGMVYAKFKSSYETGKLQNIENYDKAIKEADIAKATKSFLGDIANKNVSDITNMDQDKFNALKGELKDRASAWKNMQTLTGAATASAIDSIAEAVKEKME